MDQCAPPLPSRQDFPLLTVQKGYQGNWSTCLKNPMNWMADELRRHVPWNFGTSLFRRLVQKATVVCFKNSN
jgi:hypothetical protein